MQVFFERLSRLKKEIVSIHGKKKKKFKPNQQIMIDFINAVTKQAEFEINSQKIILRRGDKKKGFIHILEKHYCRGCRGEITTSEILNMMDIIKRGIKLESEGNTNSDLVVYKRTDTQHKLVLKPLPDGSLVVTMYGLS